MTIIVPHFAFPFNFAESAGTKSVAVIEQDTDEEIMACVQVIIRTIKGEREDLVDFGVTPQEFRQGGIDIELLRNEILEWEPRAEILIEARGVEWLENLYQETATVRVRGPHDA